jgi:glucuronokinase
MNLQQKNSFELKAPARINLLGNGIDGLHGDYHTLSIAISSYAGLTISPAEKINFSWVKRGQTESKGITPAWRPDLEWVIGGGFKPGDVPPAYHLMAAALNHWQRDDTDKKEMLAEFPFSMRIWTEIPRQSGLGGSSVLIILVLAALRAFYRIPESVENKYVLAEMTQRIEERDMGIAAGFADRYVPLFGGTAYIDYRGKLKRAEIGEEPYATYERLDRFVPELPLVVIYSGDQHSSGDVHGRIRQEFRAAQAAASQSSEAREFLDRFKRMAELVWRGKTALLAHDLRGLGKLMTRCDREIDSMMNVCGFVDGVGEKNRELISLALEEGALAAKLTGAGGGGSICALVEPERIPDFCLRMKDITRNLGYTEAEVFPINIDRDGLQVRQLSGV